MVRDAGARGVRVFAEANTESGRAQLIVLRAYDINNKRQSNVKNVRPCRVFENYIVSASSAAGCGRRQATCDCRCVGIGARGVAAPATVC